MPPLRGCDPEPEAQSLKLAFLWMRRDQIRQAGDWRCGYGGAGAEAEWGLREWESNLGGVREGCSVDDVECAVVGANEEKVAGRT
jgi:hypothetical protein